MIELQSEGVLFVRPFLAVTAGIVVLFVGKALNRRVAILREYNIPEPVTGGLLFAICVLARPPASGYQITFELTARDVLLVYFFTTIGINARVSDLRAGGRPLVILLAAVAVFMLLQNGLGVAVAALFGRPLAMGVLAGSVSLLGGHGTAIAWAPTFVAQRGIGNALEIGVLSATMGLVLASLAGGPVARFLVERHRLEGPAGDAPEVGVHYGDAQPGIDYFSFLHAILAIHVCGVIGILAPSVAGKRRLQAAALRSVPARRDRAHQPAAARRAARSLAEPYARARPDRGGVARRLPRDVAHEHAALGARRSRRPVWLRCSAWSCCWRSSSRCSCSSRSSAAITMPR